MMHCTSHDDTMAKLDLVACALLGEEEVSHYTYNANLNLTHAIIVVDGCSYQSNSLT